MTSTMKRLGIDRMNADERLSLLEEIWDSLSEEKGALSLTDAERAELDKRLEDFKRNPDDVVPWDVVKEKSPPTGGR
jgi:putative addiction module component (TIGR02574 family)